MTDSGGVFTTAGVADALQQGRTQQLWQVIMTSDESGKIVARGQLRLANVPAAGLPDKVVPK